MKITPVTKTCIVCGNEMVDTSPNHSKKYCSYECLIAGRRKENRESVGIAPRKTYHVGFSDGWKIQECCKTCSYRRCFATGSFIREDNTDWSDTYCSYLEKTGELRGCEPKGNHCAKYIPKYEEETA